MLRQVVENHSLMLPHVVRVQDDGTQILKQLMALKSRVAYRYFVNVNLINVT